MTQLQRIFYKLTLEKNLDLLHEIDTCDRL